MRKNKSVCIAGVVLSSDGLYTEAVAEDSPAVAVFSVHLGLSRKEFYLKIAEGLEALASSIREEVNES